MKTDRKPPLARSPMRVHSRRGLPSNTKLMRTPSGYLAKTQIPNPASDPKQVEEIGPEYLMISFELKALAKMVEEELGNASRADSISLFERGRLYDEYSARRNERLKRKKQSEAGAAAEPKTAYNLGVKVESTNRRKDSRKSAAPSVYSVDRSEHPRYALRNIKKPPLPLPMNVEMSAGGGRNTRAQRARRN
ncbi:hypothetical protein Nepgr_020748 [Nepenthes gracilis]|uniref:Uncharacterized protein n=1 Tax=Nepenthes gracilis TaxID=150966 RepID=A0AAD3SXI6_NEPGR|nr:hypothetical protein Nepgr_020748 [Nepenthes gracilis]